MLNRIRIYKDKDGSEYCPDNVHWLLDEDDTGFFVLTARIHQTYSSALAFPHDGYTYLPPQSDTCLRCQSDAVTGQFCHTCGKEERDPMGECMACEWDRFNKGDGRPSPWPHGCGKRHDGKEEFDTAAWGVKAQAIREKDQAVADFLNYAPGDDWAGKVVFAPADPVRAAVLGWTGEYPSDDYNLQRCDGCKHYLGPSVSCPRVKRWSPPWGWCKGWQVRMEDGCVGCPDLGTDDECHRERKCDLAAMDPCVDCEQLLSCDGCVHKRVLTPDDIRDVKAFSRTELAAAEQRAYEQGLKERQDCGAYAPDGMNHACVCPLCRKRHHPREMCPVEPAVVDPVTPGQLYRISDSCLRELVRHGHLAAEELYRRAELDSKGLAR